MDYLRGWGGEKESPFQYGNICEKIAIERPQKFIEFYDEWGQLNPSKFGLLEKLSEYKFHKRR